jgi:ATP-binding cassette subfamily B protein
MKELLYLNKYFVKYKYSFHWVLYSQLSRKFSCFSRLNLLVIRLRQLNFSENKDIAASVIREELIRNILLIIATTIIAGFNVLMRQTLIVISAYRI